TKIFDPTGIITKQEIAQIVVNVYARNNTITDDDYAEAVSSSAIELKQTKADDWAKNCVSWGLTHGFWSVDDFKVKTNGNTGATSEISRQMMAKWIVDSMGYRTFGLRVFDYDDASKIDPVYLPYVDSLYKYAIMQGDGDNFKPESGMTRAEAAAIGVRMYDENNGGSSKLEASPFVFESGVIESVDTKYQTFKIGEKLIQIPKEAKILLDGAEAKFEDIKNLSGKKLSLSLYVAGDNTYTVVAQTKPVTITGTLLELQRNSVTGVKNSDYKVATININGLKVDFVINSATEELSSLSLGNSVQFITDGIYILEIE
ncbi:MAG: S-layer homology domain-containing protein, partial [Bacillota bacterium]|nr:S-layer homology domain-containing protein [Bacillota bacterium]